MVSRGAPGGGSILPGGTCPPPMPHLCPTRVFTPPPLGGPRMPQEAPRASQEGPRGSQEGPRGSQEGPRSSQEAILEPPGREKYQNVTKIWNFGVLTPPFESSRWDLQFGNVRNARTSQKTFKNLKNLKSKISKFQNFEFSKFRNLNFQKFQNRFF